MGVELGNQPHFLRFQNRSEAQDGADGETNLQASKSVFTKKSLLPPLDMWSIVMTYRWATFLFMVCLPEMVQHTALMVILASNLLPLTFLTARTRADLLVQNHVGSFIWECGAVHSLPREAQCWTPNVSLPPDKKLAGERATATRSRLNRSVFFLLN